MNSPTPGSQAWLDLVDEPIIDPTRPIVDPHHHLWNRPNSTYALAELWADTDSGHNIEKTVFLECSASYREVGRLLRDAQGRRGREGQERGCVPKGLGTSGGRKWEGVA